MTTSFRQAEYNRDVVPDLLPALAGGLDLRDIFEKLSGIAARIIPHDEAHLALTQPDGSGLRLYVSAPSGAAEVVCAEEPAAIAASNEPQIMDGPPAPERGLVAGLRVPVIVDDRVVGVLSLYSRSADGYSGRDLIHAQRLAAYLAVALAHQRLAEEARDAAVERERAAAIESSVEMLRAIGEVLDFRSVFPRVSEIAGKMLPHDAMAMVFVDEEGRVTDEARSTDDFPPLPSRVAPTRQPDHRIVDDLTTQPLPSGKEPTDRLIAAGYRSMVSVRMQARDQLMILAFFSKRVRAFDRRDLLMARRVADHIALAVSHGQLAEAARQVAEARGRAERLEARVRVLTRELEAKAEARVVGQSAAWLDALKRATQVAATDTTVLLTGESGTGKEVVARFIHRASPRSKGPFTAINCAALPEHLLESELFGYERGAFTSAEHAKPGQIEMASGGVLFLDEVSEMSPSAQAKFLRVLQEREFQRLGGTRTLKADVRVIAATNRDLRKAVDREAFREDLFYRLRVFDIHLAPLRERREDIIPLSTAILEEIGTSFGRPPAGLTRDARDALLHYDWPGNVRELRNALERAAILSDGGLINADHLALPLASAASARGSTTDLNVVERETIERVLRETRWNKSKAAQRLGLSRTQLYVRMRRYGL